MRGGPSLHLRLLMSFAVVIALAEKQSAQTGEPIAIS